MIRTYKKGENHVLSDHFSSQEFDCKCTRLDCKFTAIDDILISLLELLHGPAGRLGINSGFRCHAHNIEVGGAPESRHPMGQAADVRSLEGLTGDHLSAMAEKIPEIAGNAIGTYPDRIHIDTRGHRARWSSSIPQ